MHNISSIVDNILHLTETHKIDDGAYQRWTIQDENNSRSFDLNAYGCADAANILYTCGKFPSDASEREMFVKTLCSLQDEKTGLFKEATHHYLHTTAHCAAALELFEEKPIYPLKAMERYITIEGLYELLESIDWDCDPWDGSHVGAGVYAALVLTGAVDEAWEKAYFDWFRKECDPISGMWRKGSVEKNLVHKAHFLAGTFHYLFNHEYAKQSMPYPDKLIDTCIELYDTFLKENTQHHLFGFFGVDWVYSLNRATRQSSHRFDEAKNRLRQFANDLIKGLEEINWGTNTRADDLHASFGTLCCLAELQNALPGEIYSKVPLKLVLDRRPFI